LVAHSDGRWRRSARHRGSALVHRAQQRRLGQRDAGREEVALAPKNDAFGMELNGAF